MTVYAGDYIHGNSGGPDQSGKVLRRLFRDTTAELTANTGAGEWLVAYGVVAGPPSGDADAIYYYYSSGAWHAAARVTFTPTIDKTEAALDGVDAVTFGGIPADDIWLCINGVDTFFANGDPVTVAPSEVSVLEFVGKYKAPAAFIITQAPTIAAAGTTQGDAAPVVGYNNPVATVAVGAGVVMPAGQAGDEKFITNQHASRNLNVYPASGEQFAGHAVNAAIVLTPGLTAHCVCLVDGVWTAFASL